MRKCALRTLIVGGLLVSALIAAAQEIVVTVDGKRVNFPDITPRQIRGKVMVPLRGVFETMGASVDYEASAQKVVATKADDVVELTIGDDFARKNGETILMHARGVIYRGRTLVPLRFLAESLGAKVEWIGNDRTVKITTHTVADPEGENGKPPPR